MEVSEKEKLRAEECRKQNKVAYKILDRKTIIWDGKIYKEGQISE